MALAIDDQRLVNDMHLQPKYLRKIMCNGITKRFPSLPLSIRGSLREDGDAHSYKNQPRSQSTTTDDEEEGLTPGKEINKLYCIVSILVQLAINGHYDSFMKFIQAMLDSFTIFFITIRQG